MTRNGRWINVVLFVLAAVALAAVAGVLLDPGLGRPDEARRVRHPAGFSFVPPRGWDARVVRAEGDGIDFLRILPDRVTGRGITMTLSKFPPGYVDDAPSPTPVEFQGQPATVAKKSSRHDWLWRMKFRRGDGQLFGFEVASPIETDFLASPYAKFFETFKVEPPLDLRAATGRAATAPAATSTPTAP